MGWLLALCLGAAAKGPALVYVPMTFELPELDGIDRKVLAASLLNAQTRGRVGPLQLVDSQGPLDTWPVEALYAAWIGSARWARGAEVDLIVPVDGQRTAVTIRNATSGEMQLTVGVHLPEPAPPASPASAESWAAALAQRHGVAFDDSGLPWTREEIAPVAAALAMLSDSERVTLEGIHLGRAGKSPRAPRTEYAWYDTTTEPPRINFFNLCFEASRGGFVGPADQPSSPALMTALHEFGHALSDHPRSQAYERYAEATDRVDASTKWRTYRRMGARGPVIDAFRAVRGPTRGPTPYGRAIQESFAEAFALFHADPEALERVMPEVYAWLLMDGHLTWEPGD
jgi:hypothetical protein